MDQQRLTDAIAKKVDPTLAAALVASFLQLRRDAAAKTLHGAIAGKFVETFVQSLQWLATGRYDAQPAVDQYLSQKVEHEKGIPEGLRISGARVARSIYTFRNKRNIAHNGEVDPNTIDLAFTAHASAWIIAEVLRTATSISMQEAGRLIELVHAPIGDLVEEIDGTTLVHGDMSATDEVMVLLHTYHPDYVSLEKILDTTRLRNPKTVKNRIIDMLEEKHIFGDAKRGYKLTTVGFKEAVTTIQRLRQ